MLPARITRRIDRSGGPDACHPWTGCLNGVGYGKVYVGGQPRVQYVHRVVWEDEHGSIPDGLVIDHLCDATNCANTRHMRVCTQRENTLRGCSPAAIHARKTHCVHGHEYTAENTVDITRPSGKRQRNCLTCRRAADKRRYARAGAR